MKLATLAISGLLSINTFAMPKDLQDLKDRWLDLDANDKRSALILEPELVERSESFTLLDLMTESNENNDFVASELKSAHLERLDKDVRTTLVKLSFNTNSETPAFCDGITPQKYEPKEDETLSSDELKEKEKKLNRSHCRKEISNMLRGVFYMNPVTYFLKTTNKDGEEKLSFYVQSVISEQSFLKFVLKQ